MKSWNLCVSKSEPINGNFFLFCDFCHLAETSIYYFNYLSKTPTKEITSNFVKFRPNSQRHHHQWFYLVGPLSWTDSGPQETLVGVYDGHGGTEASCFVKDKLFCNLKSMLKSLMHGYIFHFIRDFVSIIVSNGSVCTNS